MRVGRRVRVGKELIVVINGRRSYACARCLEDWAEPGVDITAASSCRECPSRETWYRSLQHRARVDEIELCEAMIMSVVLRRAQPSIHDPAHDAAILGAEIPRIKVDLFEHLGRHDRRQPAEMIDERDGRAVDE